MHGSSAPNSVGNYGTQGVFAPANSPPAIYEACEWTDASGNFWLFGGSAGAGAVNALWKFDVVLNQWAWISGSSSPMGMAVYGTMGVPSVNNTPGVRYYGSMSWTDLNGNLWLFGGNTQNSSNAQQLNNELWMFNPSTYEWTWVRGNTASFASLGNYGVMGVPSPSNEPPGRCESACTWVDAQGDLWMYGGQNYYNDFLGDLWRYNIAGNMWTFIHGSTTAGAPPVYGTIGVEAPGNTPGGRNVYAKGIQSGGFFYLFGGTNAVSLTDDLWRYNLSTGNWMCILGNNFDFGSGPYPSECEYWDNSKPDDGGEVRTCWSDTCGIWIFGGRSTNILWHYEFGTNGFAVIIPDRGINYGTLNAPAVTNCPPDRGGGISWKDSNGNLWMFGGASSIGLLNDLWKFSIDSSCKCAATEVTAPPPAPPPVTQDSVTIIPNVFTPGSDNVNDLLIWPVLLNGERVLVYDRWGVNVFTFSNFAQQWDGTYRGNPCSDGVYYYLQLDANNKLVRKGFIQLIRE